MILPATQAFNPDKSRQTLNELLQEGERMFPGISRLIVDPTNRTGLLNDAELLGHFEQPAHLYLMEYFMLTALQYDPTSKKRAFARFRSETTRQKTIREFELATGGALDHDEAWPRTIFTQNKMDKIMDPYLEKAYSTKKFDRNKNTPGRRNNDLTKFGRNAPRSLKRPGPPRGSNRKTEARRDLPTPDGYSNDLF